MDTVPILVNFDLEFTVLLEHFITLLSNFGEICEIQGADHEDIEFFEIRVCIYF